MLNDLPKVLQLKKNKTKTRQNWAFVLAFWLWSQCSFSSVNLSLDITESEQMRFYQILNYQVNKMERKFFNI